MAGGPLARCDVPRAQQLMRETGLDAVIATSPVNVAYLSGYRCWMDGILRRWMVEPGDNPSSRIAIAYVVMPNHGDPTLITGWGFGADAAQSWIKDVRTAGGPASESLDYAQSGYLRRLMEIAAVSPKYSTPFDALLSVLEEKGLNEGRLGVERWDRSELDQSLPDSLPRAQLMSADVLMRVMRMCKSPSEIAALCKAAEIAERAADLALSGAAAGDTIGSLYLRYRQELAAHDADLDHFAYSVRGTALSTMSQTPYQLAAGDVLYIDHGCVKDGWFSDTAITIVVGEAAPAMLNLYAELREAIEAGVATATPGTRAAAVQATMQEALGPLSRDIAYPQGHGLGLELRDLPIIVRSRNAILRDECIDLEADLPLQPDMVVNLEAGVHRPGRGAVQLERTFVITKHGARPLLDQNRSSPLLV